VTAPIQTAEQAVDAGTEYVILHAPDGAAFTSIATVTAPSASQAIRQHCLTMQDVDATFAAVPARSWRPVKVKTKIALDFGEVSS
jgi:hypothetical protein